MRAKAGSGGVLALGGAALVGAVLWEVVAVVVADYSADPQAELCQPSAPYSLLNAVAAVGVLASGVLIWSGFVFIRHGARRAALVAASVTVGVLAGVWVATGGVEALECAVGV